MNPTMPGVMPQGSQMDTMQQPVNMPGFQPQYPAAPGIGGVPMNRPRTIPCWMRSCHRKCRWMAV